MLDATLILLHQSHKQLSKMLIEHTSGSIEDKLEIGKCVGALRWSAECFNQQSLLDWPTQNVSQQSSNQSSSQLKVIPKKVNAVQKKSTQGSNKKVNAAPTSVNFLTSIFVPMSTTYKNRTLHKISAQTDHALTKVNAGQTCPETLTAENLLR